MKEAEEGLDGRPSNRELLRSILLFFATAGTVFMMYPGGSEANPPTTLDRATFSASLMALLLAHEMGHYFVARYHGFRLSLPTFIPFPMGFGTLGAVIQLRSPPRSRTALLEMGAAGPLAGAVVAFLLLAQGIPHTAPGDTFQAGDALFIYNDPLIVKLLGYLLIGAPPDRYGTFTPTALAGWVGCLITGINLLPSGQLDGGHIVNGLSSVVSRLLSRVLPAALIGAGVLVLGWAVAQALLDSRFDAESLPSGPLNWIVWGALLRFTSVSRPMPIPAGTELTPRARMLGMLAIILFFLTFMPVPMEMEIYGG